MTDIIRRSPALLLIFSLAFVCEGRSAPRNNFFDLPAEIIGRQVLAAVGCTKPEVTGTNWSCKSSGGIPGTTDITVFGRSSPSPKAKAGDQNEEPHVFMAWTDSPPGGLLPAHAERDDAREMFRRLLDVVVVADPAPIAGAFFAPVMERNTYQVVAFQRNGLKIFVERDDNNGVTDRRVFIGGPKFVLPDR
jgi:hypothetical protein